jgi:NAD(P)-dependent dehydrogenase (short-subunit alcohol dehydrogenase family)
VIWSYERIQADMSEKVVLITGATSGIGKSAAMRIAEHDCILVLLGRDANRGKETMDAIHQKTGKRNVDLLLADLSSQSEIRRVAAEFLAKYSRLDVLINNAGLAVGARTLTHEGIELTFAVNHLAYFLLTNLLLDSLKSSAPSRIINVSSEAHRRVVPDFENLQAEKKFSGFAAYSITKYCNLLFTYELSRRLQGTGVTVNAMHPGYLSTGIFRAAPGFVKFLVKLTAGKPEKGGDALDYLAFSPDVSKVTGKYFNGTREVSSSPVSQDRVAAERLWKISSDLTGVG